ncbi:MULTISPECIES: tyrosine-type recombinase/integrase [unclassified Microcoleus]|uniref:tyrosine-type recombinase/integrase n=1 Tax=unclassified Microcoleus TaxID=2642155 RepID=UPI002FD10558
MVNCRVGRPTNDSLRDREYLLESEITRLIATAKGNKDTFLATRNHLIILLSYRHGLRISELTGLKWEQIELEEARLHVKRLKGSNSGVHPMQSDECRLAAKLRKNQPTKSPWMFTSATGLALTRDGVAKALGAIALAAKLEIKFHHHMLRHSCGYALAAKGCDTRLIQEYLGHRSIEHTVGYTALDPSRFENLWEK